MSQTLELHAYYSVQGLQPSPEAGWPVMAADSGALGSHDLTCEVSSAH